jgi:hypothetical protein
MRSKSFRLGGNWYTILIELFILIAGITLSLALDSWREDRKQMRTEESYLKKLKDDLEYDQVLLQSYHDMRENQLQLVGRLVKHLRGMPPAMPTDSILITFFELARDNKFLPRTATYQTLTSTGQLNLLRDQEIVTALLQLHELEYQFLSFSRSDVANFRKDFILPFYLKELDFGGLMNPSELEVALSKLGEDQYLENLLIYSQITLQSVVLAYNSAIESNQELVEMIEKRLD